MKRDEKIQGYIFKALLKSEKVKYFECDENSIAVTWDGFRMHILPKSDICFALDKCDVLKPVFELIEKTSNDVDLKLTDNLKQIGKNMVQKLEASDFNAWVNARYIKDFGAAKYYGTGPTNRVLVEDAETGEIIGCVLPIHPKNIEEKSK